MDLTVREAAQSVGRKRGNVRDPLAGRPARRSAYRSRIRCRQCVQGCPATAPTDPSESFLEHMMRKLDKRCAHRADGAPGSTRRRFRRSETLCGQGQDRTVDLPLFRSTALSAVPTCKNGRH